MQENVGTIDRWVRVAVGGTLVTAGLYGLARRNVLPAALLTTGALVLESALTRVCPVNAWLGVDTRRLDAAAEPELGEEPTGRWTLGGAAASPMRDELGAAQRVPADS